MEKGCKMNNSCKTLTLALSSIVLSGCLEVKDDSNDAVVTALEAQNTILQQQQQQQQEQKIASVTLFGNIIDAGDASIVTSAQISVKVGTTWRDTVEMSGEFSITNLPANTDIIIKIESSDGAFLARSFYGTTPQVSGNQVNSRSLGDLLVSKPVVKNYDVLDAETNTAFEGLTFTYTPSASLYGYSVNTSASRFKNDTVSSTFDAITGLYSITLPEDFDVEVTAALDLDNDDIIDVIPDNSDYWGSNELIISGSTAKTLATIYVNRTPDFQPVELRLSVIDELGTPLEDIEFFVDDNTNEQVDLNYDTSTNEYVISYQSSSLVTLNMASFTDANGVIYSSGELHLFRVSTDSLDVSSNGFNHYVTDSATIVDDVATLTVQPKKSYTPSSYIDRISTAIDFDDNYSLKQFYESPIELLDDSVSLIHRDVFSVTKGNASDSDLVTNGTTEISISDIEVPLDITLSHNNTFLTAQSNSTLAPGKYYYRTGYFINRETGELSTNYSDTTQLTINEQPSNLVFDINDIKLDNNNGTTNGMPIVDTNTAGIANTASDSYASNFLYLPQSIEALEFLQLSMISYIYNGVLHYSNSQYEYVTDNNINSLNSYYLVKLATNENVRPSGINNYRYQTSITDGLWYRSYYNYFYSSDNTTTSTNTATFNYVYRVAGEETVVQGTITLPVL